MRMQNKFNILFSLIILVLLIILISCSYQPGQKGKPAYSINLSERNAADIVITLNDTNDKSMVIVLDNNKIIDVAEIGKREQINDQQEEQEGPEEQENQEEQQVNTRISEVEFYFLLKGKSYFKHILKENQEKTYNLSGYLVTIEPIIITSDRVKFRINNYTTRALAEDDFDSTDTFEIIVKDIYYRP